MRAMTVGILACLLLLNQTVVGTFLIPTRGEAESNWELESHEDQGASSDLATYDSLRSLTEVSETSQGECQASLASTLQVKCGEGASGKEILSESQRRAIAISFTICSMLSASQSVPKECTPWAPQIRTSSEEVTRDVGRMSLCVAALRRSAQDWTSYESYLAKATELCLGLEGRHHAETARQAYIDLTDHSIESFKLLRKQLMDRESDDEEARRAMREVMMDVQHSTAEVSSILNDLLIHESRQRLSTIELESLIQTFSSDLPGVLSGLSEEGARQMRGMLMQNEEIWMAQSKSLGDSLAVELRLRTQDQHQMEADANLLHFRHALEQINGISRRESEALHMNTLAQLSTLETIFGNMSSGLIVANSFVTDINDAVSDLAPTLRSSLENAKDLTVLHNDMTLSLDAASGISQIIRQELNDIRDAINETLTGISSWRRSTRKQRVWFPSGFSLFTGPAMLPFPAIEDLVQNGGLRVALQIMFSIFGTIAHFLVLFIGIVVTALISIWLSVSTGMWRVVRWTCAGFARKAVKRTKDVWKEITDSPMRSDEEWSTKVVPAAPIYPILKTPTAPMMRQTYLKTPADHRRPAPPAYTSPKQDLIPFVGRSAFKSREPGEGASRESNTSVVPADLDFRSSAMSQNSFGNLQRVIKENAGRNRRAVSSPI